MYFTFVFTFKRLLRNRYFIELQIRELYNKTAEKIATSKHQYFLRVIFRIYYQ